MPCTLIHPQLDALYVYTHIILNRVINTKHAHYSLWAAYGMFKSTFAHTPVPSLQTSELNPVPDMTPFTIMSMDQRALCQL